MIHSVDEYVAGEEYEIPDEEANRFVVLGYAEGDQPALSDEERAAIEATNQAVSLGG